MEHVKDVPKLKELGIDGDVDMAINCEWVTYFARLLVTLSLIFYLQGAFDSFVHEHLPRTKYDINVDESSNKPGEQAFEVSTRYENSLAQPLTHIFPKKLISGRYLGEIMRLVICELIDEGVLFLGQNTYKLENPYVFDTAFLSLMERSVGVLCSYQCSQLTL